MPDERREIQLKRPASHTCSRRFDFYNTRRWAGARGEVMELVPGITTLMCPGSQTCAGPEMDQLQPKSGRRNPACGTSRGERCRTHEANGFSGLNVARRVKRNSSG